jgi:hypothetical protein
MLSGAGSRRNMVVCSIPFSRYRVQQTLTRCTSAETGYDLINQPMLNKETVFSEKEGTAEFSLGTLVGEEIFCF